MSAAARATARSPATVAWLSVTELALASMAMPATAAMLFMTVLGNIMGESPDGPRLRKPSTGGSKRYASTWRVFSNSRARIRSTSVEPGS